MSKCKVCSKYSKNNPFIKFFRFPKDSSRCSLWASRCNLLEELSKSNSVHFNKAYRICSDHFSNAFIKWDGHRAKLLPNAVPEIFNNIAVTKTKINPNNPSHSIPEMYSFFSGEDAEFHLQMLDHVCRFCATERPNLTMLFGAYGKSLDLPNKIKYIPVMLSENDVMPTKICQECIKKVEQGYLFVKCCLEADEKLRIYLNKTDSTTTYDKIDTKSTIVTTFQLFKKEMDTTAVKSSSVLREIDLSGSLALQNDYASMFMAESTPKLKTARSASKEIVTGKYPCHYCHRRFQSLDILSAHTKAHFLNKDGAGNFTCDECNVPFQNRFKLASHRRRHFNEKPYQCFQCEARFYDSSLLRQHSFTHSPKQFSCAICEKVFLRKHKLMMHIQDVRHFYGQEKKSESKDYKCMTCSKSFLKLSSLQRHWKTHWSVKNFLCAFCGKLFTRMDCLKKHYRIHTGERPYSCFVCGFSFKQKGDCKKHEDNH